VSLKVLPVEQATLVLHGLNDTTAVAVPSARWAAGVFTAAQATAGEIFLRLEGFMEIR
jgi:hypothetical protein